MQGKKWPWDSIRKVLMNKSINKDYVCEPADTVHHSLNSDQNFKNQSCTSSSYSNLSCTCFGACQQCCSTTLCQNVWEKGWSKAPVHSFCCEDDTTQHCALLRLHWINTLGYNKPEKTFCIYTKHCQASQTTFTSLPQRWLLVIMTKITFSSWLWKNKEN